MNETENQAVDAFVSAFESEAAKIGIPKKLATCGAIFTISAHKRVGLKIILDAPTASGKTLLLKHFIFPLTEAKTAGLDGNLTLGKLRDFLSALKSERQSTFVLDYAAMLPKKGGPILAEWDGSILLCMGTISGDMRGRSFPGFEHLKVSREEGKCGKAPPRGGKKPNISGLLEQLRKLPVIDRDSLLERISEL